LGETHYASHIQTHLRSSINLPGCLAEPAQGAERHRWHAPPTEAAAGPQRKSGVSRETHYASHIQTHLGSSINLPGCLAEPAQGAERHRCTAPYDDSGWIASLNRGLLWRRIESRGIESRGIESNGIESKGVEEPLHEPPMKPMRALRSQLPPGADAPQPPLFQGFLDPCCACRRFCGARATVAQNGCRCPTVAAAQCGRVAMPAAPGHATRLSHSGPALSPITGRTRDPRSAFLVAGAATGKLRPSRPLPTGQQADHNRGLNHKSHPRRLMGL
jgi:hypothetical protein